MTYHQTINELLASWDFWSWAISTFVTVGSIFGAAYCAQLIFNRNARTREKRERRLKALAQIVEKINSVYTFTSFSETEPSKLQDNYNHARHTTDHIEALIELYDFDLMNELDDLMRSFENLKDKINSYSIHYQKKETNLQYLSTAKSLEELIVKKLWPSLRKFRVSTIKLYSQIETNY